MITTWTFGDEKWRIVSEPTKDNISHLKLYADDILYMRIIIQSPI
jgi:hypothetical protein